MLQQTQAARVAALYPPFLLRFPDLRRLAAAPRSAVVRAWAGMGYNNRAVRLHRLAREVVRNHGGRIPRDAGLLSALPGIGPYTSAAVRCFAFGEQTAVVDVNVRRVLSRLVLARRDPRELLAPPAAAALADRLLPPRRAAAWNEALMDLGALICTARTPRCAACPVASACPSRGRIRPASPGPPKREPSRRGVPDRITRGRIVEALRRASGPVHPQRLAARVVPEFGAEERRWFFGLLRALERDGVIRIHRGASPRVRLA